MNARVLLPICFVALVALAGCFGFGSGLLGGRDGPSPPPQFDGIHLNNEHNQSHALEVVVTENESVVYWQRVELNASFVREDGTQVAPSEHLEPPVLGDRGDYVVHFRLDDNSSGKRFAMREYLTEKCTGWFVEVERDGTLNYGVVC